MIARAERIRQALGVEVVRETSCAGGCIHDARILHLADGRRVFLKTNSSPAPEIFRCEAEGLTALRAVGVLRVPEVLVADDDFLVLEGIDVGAKSGDFSERFGRAFADFHRRGTGERFGFAHDNYLGATPQPNAPTNDWTEFWRDRRLGHQLALARRGGVASGELSRLGERLQERLGEWLDEPAEAPCLLHGDLWGGNYLVDAGGAPVLIDPAAYYGRREADLAMTRLFGGFDAHFYAAYEEVWPLAPGSTERLAIYELYHLLNHLNLFGSGYLGGCLNVLRRLVG